jgi:hypothetical protein
VCAIRRVPSPLGREREDTPHDGRLGLEDAALDVIALAVRREDRDVLVPEHHAPGDVAGQSLAAHGIVGPLSRLVAFDLVREAADGQEDLVGRGIEGALAVLQVVDDADAARDDLFQQIGRFDLLTPKPTLLAHHEHLERRARRQRIDQADEPGPLRELRAADPVVDVDVRLGDRPSLHGRVCAGVVDLTGHRLRFLSGASLLGGLTGVDGGDHHGISSARVVLVVRLRVFQNDPELSALFAHCAREHGAAVNALTGR